MKCTISREISHRVFGGLECQPAGFPCVYVAVVASTDDDEKKSASASKKLPLLAYNLKLLEIIRLAFSEIIHFLPIMLRFCDWLHPHQ